MPRGPITPSHEALRSRRIGACGGSVISSAVARFCRELGYALAGEKGLIIVTGGSKGLPGRPDQHCADWCYVRGALARLKEDKIAPEQRIETMLPERDDPVAERFREGRVVVLPNRSRQSRRFAVVGATDALVAVAGESGTREMIDMALAIEKPVLPLPFAGGVCRDRWHENKELIREWFGISIETAQYLEQAQLSGMDESAVKNLAGTVRDLLLHRLKRKCFVMMPFSAEHLPLYERVLLPAIEEHSFMAVRADRLNMTGNAVEVLRAAINACDCAMAVITGWNPNVMYELGLAHAQGKPVILLCRYDSDGDSLSNLPYDLRNERVFGYRGEPDELRRAIGEVLAQVR